MIGADLPRGEDYGGAPWEKLRIGQGELFRDQQVGRLIFRGQLRGIHRILGDTMPTIGDIIAVPIYH